MVILCKKDNVHRQKIRREEIENGGREVRILVFLAFLFHPSMWVENDVNQEALVSERTCAEDYKIRCMKMVPHIVGA